MNRNEKMNKNLLSIIIPVYNGEKYIESIYYNIKNQSYRPLELIFVNDGSVDQSQTLIDTIVEEHNNAEHMTIKHLHQKNRGIAGARNAGLEEASGKYIMFMDQDDWLEPDCAESLMRATAETDADIVIGGVNKVSEEGKVVEAWILNPQLSWSKFRITAPWGRVFKKSLIDEKKMEFFDTKISEDLYFNILFLSYASKVEIIPYIGYNWVQNQNSESHNNWSKMSDDRNPLIMLTNLHNRMGNSGILNREEIEFFFTKYLVWYLLFCSRGAESKQVKERTEEIFGWLQRYYPYFLKYAWKSFRFPKGELTKVRLCVASVLTMKRLGVLGWFLELYRRI